MCFMQLSMHTSRGEGIFKRLESKFDRWHPALCITEFCFFLFCFVFASLFFFSSGFALAAALGSLCR